MAKAPANLVDRFWSKVQRSDGCWLWIGARTHNGYGRFSLKRGAETRAHRFAWELQQGPVPHEMCVCHHCDVPACVRPEHLFLGTPLDNARDREQKGRGIFGERHHKAKLTSAAVDVVRRLRREGLSFPAIARRFDITPEQAGNIARGRHWVRQ